MHLREKILNELQKNPGTGVFALTKKLNVSRAYISRLLQELRQEGTVVLVGKTRQASYVLAQHTEAVHLAQKNIRHLSLRLRSKGLAEDIVFGRMDRETGIFFDVPDNVRKIVQFGFTEMLNNAIDHSRSEWILVDCRRTDTAISFTVRDYGIGIFKNVRDMRRLPGTLEAIQDLLKGKLTTMPEKHSGQGVFFTSKAADAFTVDSGDKRLMINNLLPDLFISNRTFLQGTKISFAVGIRSKKNLAEIFSEFTSDQDGSQEFSKTRVSIKLYQFGNDLLSRSEAKRVVVNLEHFQEVELDFFQVKTVGQAFADEIFRVWQNIHPAIRLIPIHTNENIAFMVKRAGGKI